LQHGLLRASFIPDRAQRELRDLTRTRTSLIDARTAAVNRVQKVLEDANVTDELACQGGQEGSF
jgi:transposase